MKTLILPGFSPSNLEWAMIIEKELASFNPEIVSWEHWQTSEPKPGWTKKEAKKIADSIKEQTVNIISKSMGTLVAMELLKLKPTQINKIILCGIPLNDTFPLDQEEYNQLSKLDHTKVICFQNQDDHHGTYQQAKEFLAKISSSINIKSMPRADHDYPFPQQFEEFLK